MKRSGNVLAVLVAFTVLLGICGGRVQAEETDRTVRVGYPIREGLTDKDANGFYCGYTYEYLANIAQYADLSYEFVEVEGTQDEQLAKCLEMLEQGEIDIIGNMPYLDDLAQRYDYVLNNYGTYGLAIYVEADNNELSTTSIYSADNVRIAVCEQEQSPEITALQNFIQEHHLKLELVYVDSREEQQEALEEDLADALLSNTLERPSDNLRSIRQFDTEPFYFLAAKGQEDLVRIMNGAISESQENDPTYENTLYDKYFSDPPQILTLTEEEQAYIAQLGTLSVRALGGNAPICYTDAAGKPGGFMVDVMDYIADNTGLQFNIEVYNDIDAYQEQVNQGNTDIIICRSDMRSVLQTSGYYASRKFLTIPISLVIRVGNEESNLLDKREAVPYLAYSLDEEDLLGTPEACLNAINKGEADYGYINAYATDYYTRMDNLTNAYVYLQAEQHSESLVIAVHDELNEELLPIVNKMLHNLQEENLSEEFLYRNIINGADLSFKTYVRHNVKEVIMIVSMLLCLMLLLLLGFRYIMEKKRQEQILEQARIDSLTGCLARSVFMEETQKLLEQAAPNHPVLYLMIDVDDFKMINDSFGHISGDRVLQGIAAALMETFHEEKCVGRLGGDEFAVFVADAQIIADIDARLRKLFQTVADIKVEDRQKEVTLSVGGVRITDRWNVERVYDVADQTMYRVKKAGGNAWEFAE